MAPDEAGYGANGILTRPSGLQVAETQNLPPNIAPETAANPGVYALGGLKPMPVLTIPEEALPREGR